MQSRQPRGCGHVMLIVAFFTLCSMLQACTARRQQSVKLLSLVTRGDTLSYWTTHPSRPDYLTALAFRRCSVLLPLAANSSLYPFPSQLSTCTSSSSSLLLCCPSPSQHCPLRAHAVVRLVPGRCVVSSALHYLSAHFYALHSSL